MAAAIGGITSLAYTSGAPSVPMTDRPDTTSPAAPLGRILTLEDVAGLVQLSTRTVRRAILSGDLEASQLTPRRGGWRIREAAVDDWLARRSNRIHPPREPAVLPAPIQPAPVPARTRGREPAGDGRLTVTPNMGRAA
jgi:excisionase family DNA binding protein